VSLAAARKAAARARKAAGLPSPNSTHALNRWVDDGRRARAVGVVDGAPTAMLCGAQLPAKHTYGTPTCPLCLGLIANIHILELERRPDPLLG
jgi:hypothetical protein